MAGFRAAIVSLMAIELHHSEHPPTAREAATEVVRRLVGAGHTAYFAGGCVRDHLMGHEPQDYDVATSARPEQVRLVFPKARGVGESFGVMLVRAFRHTVEVATFRTDGPYSDARRPDDVEFSDAEHDARRRDFTINGLFEDPLRGRIIDYVGGKADLEARLIRAIGDPYERIAEDRLRMLRAIRFAARFAFAIESDTADAIRSKADDLAGVSRERIGQEIKRMLRHPNRAVAAWEVQYLGLDAAVLGEQHLTVAPTRLGRLPDQSPYSTSLAAWLLDRHEETAEANDLFDRVKHWGDALMLSNHERTAMRRAIDIYLHLRSDWLSMGIARQKRLASDPAFVHGLALLLTGDRPAFIDVKRRVNELSQSTVGLSPQPLIDGHDLIEAGVASPGPGFQVVLDAVYDAQLEGQIATKCEAIALAGAIVRTQEQ